MQVSGILREQYHLLKGFGPAVGSSSVPRHRATAAWMGLRDLAQPRGVLRNPAPSGPYTHISYREGDGGGVGEDVKTRFILTAFFLSFL